LQTAFKDSSQRQCIERPVQEPKYLITEGLQSFFTTDHEWFVFSFYLPLQFFFSCNLKKKYYRVIPKKQL